MCRQVFNVTSACTNIPDDDGIKHSDHFMSEGGQSQELDQSFQTYQSFTD